MTRVEFKSTALLSSALPLVFASSVNASTLTQIINPLSAPKQQVHLSELLREDGLGYRCVDEAQIDVAFFAAGKGVRLPQTCLPEPCDEALTKAGLGEIVGREPTIAEWDDYISRYSDTCRAETVAFGVVSPDAEDATDPTTFWTPYINATNSVADVLLGGIDGVGTVGTVGSTGTTGTTTTTTNTGATDGGSGNGTSPVVIVGGGGGGSGSGTAGGTGGSGGTTGGTDGSTGTDSGVAGDSGGGGTDPNDGTGGSSSVAVVPVPATLWFGLTGLLAFGGLRARRRKT